MERELDFGGSTEGYKNCEGFGLPRIRAELPLGCRISIKSMKSIRKLFGWLFGSIALWICVFEALAYRKLLLSHRSFTSLDLIQRGVMGLLVVVSAGAWWTNWKEQGGARIWGVLACLLGMFITVAGMRHIHHHRSQAFTLLLLNAFALLAFVWPDRNVVHPVRGEH